MRTSERALRAAVAAGRSQGLRVSDPVVVRDLTNVLVRLDPAPVVARVSLLFTRLRPRSWLEEQVSLARWLADAGAPVAPPTAALDPGPHDHDGLLVTLWQAVDHDPARFDAGAAGRSLRELHGTLAGYPRTLPSYDRLDEIAALVDTLAPSAAASPADLAALRRVCARLAREQRPPGQALHGDAHLNNVLWSPEGPLWTDLENACTGPVEFDLACIAWRDQPGRDAALAAYGGYDSDRLRQVTPSLSLFLAGWTLVVAERVPAEGIVADARRRVERALREGQAREM